MKFEIWHAFVIGTIISWGIYVPMLHEGQSMLGAPPGASKGAPSKGALRAFLCVGIAYFVTAVVIPMVVLLTGKGAGGEKLEMNQPRGLTFALVAGTAGAAGALGIVLAIKNGGTPLYIAPLVFAGAPIVNAIVSLIWHPPTVKPGMLFYVGMVLAAMGAGLVLYAKGKADLESRKKKAQISQVQVEPTKGI
mgnify:CR=1 FL=1